MRIDIYHHCVDDEKNWTKLFKMLEEVLGKEVAIMATLDQIITDVTAETTLIDGVSTLIAGLKKQLADALAGVLNADQQAKVDAIFTAAEANKQKLSDALAVSTT
jgi:hypothetical protein